MFAHGEQTHEEAAAKNTKSAQVVKGDEVAAKNTKLAQVVKGDVIYGDFFKDRCLAPKTLPSIIMESVQSEALKILRSDRALAFRLRPEILVDKRIKAGTKSLTKGRTPQQTIGTIMGMQGMKIHGVPENTIDMAIRKIVDAVYDAEMVPHDLEPDPHTHVNMIIDAFDTDSEDEDEDQDSGFTKIKELADQLTRKKPTEEAWRDAISVDTLKELAALNESAAPAALEIAAENSQCDLGFKENDVEEVEVHFVQEGKNKLESRGALLITIHAKRANEVAMLSASKHGSHSRWQDKSYTIQMGARNVTAGRSSKSLKISLDSSTVMHTDEDKKEGHGNYNWKEMELQVSKPGPDGSFLFTIKQLDQDHGEGENFKEGDIVQVVPATANPKLHTVRRDSVGVSSLFRSKSKAKITPERSSDEVFDQMFQRDPANHVGVVTSVSKSSNYVSVTLLAKNSLFESQDQQHVVKQYQKKRLEKLWLAHETSTLLIECVDSPVKNTVGFCRVTLGELLKGEGFSSFKGHRSLLAFFSHEVRLCS